MSSVSDALAWSHRLASLGGPTVADPAIRHDGASVSIGGLELTCPLLVDYEAGATNITVPPSWPTLVIAELDHRRMASAPTFGLAVFKQTMLVTSDDTRAPLVDHAFRVARHDHSPVMHASVTTSAGVTCWMEMRHGKRRSGLGPSHRAVLLFAGPGIASSGVIVWAPPSVADVPAIAGALVESACGHRPQGL